VEGGVVKIPDPAEGISQLEGIVALAERNSLERILDEPENEVFKREYHDLRELDLKIRESMMTAWITNDREECARLGAFVAAELPRFLLRSLAMRAVLARLYERWGGPVRVHFRAASAEDLEKAR
jgi:hypothetical protein